jgi:hypothetical protein
MKTDDLIRALAADGNTPPVPLGHAMARGLAAGVVVAIALYFATLGVRPHLLSALDHDPRVAFKIGLMVVLLFLAIPLTLRLAKPGRKANAAAMALLIVPVFLFLAVVFELFSFPEADWEHRWIGHNAAICMISIPLLALGPLCALLFVLRQGAPSHPALSGAAAGLLAGAIGTALYSTHCPDDSPLFVATWYSLGIGFVCLAGALIGARLLRW